MANNARNVHGKIVWTETTTSQEYIHCRPTSLLSKLKLDTPSGLFAKFAFEVSGYTATHHNLTNVDVDVHGRNALVRSNVTAWYVVPNVGLDLALGTYETEVVRESSDWKISRELIELISFGRVETGVVPF